jgi:transcriptional regulator with XRE-family HTH domain
MSQQTSQHAGPRSRQEELGHFLMTRRARLSPQEVGIPDVGRRRTPGLRREEVCALSGVGVSWYTWLEQGRDINVSEQVLNAISLALRLDESERTYLYNLVGLNPVAWRSGPGDEERRDMQPFVEGWLPNPAFVSNRFLTVVAANRTACAVLGIRGGGHSCINEMFVHRTVPERYPTRNVTARRVVARFRSHVSRMFDDPGVRAMVERLYQEGQEFAQLWDLHEVMDETTGAEVFWHPEVGELAFGFRVLDFGDSSDLRLTLFIPDATTDTAAKVQQLADITPPA